MKIVYQQIFGYYLKTKINKINLKFQEACKPNKSDESFSSI